MPEPEVVQATPDVRCSFCEKTPRETGPLAEGPRRVFICYVCIELCAAIIEDECKRTGQPVKHWE